MYIFFFSTNLDADASLDLCSPSPDLTSIKQPRLVTFNLPHKDIPDDSMLGFHSLCVICAVN